MFWFEFVLPSLSLVDMREKIIHFESYYINLISIAAQIMLEQMENLSTVK